MSAMYGGRQLIPGKVQKTNIDISFKYFLCSPGWNILERINISELQAREAPQLTAAAAVKEVACKDNSKYVQILRLALQTVSQPEASNTFHILYRGNLKNNSLKRRIQLKFYAKINERMLNLMVDSVVGQDFSWSFFTFSISSNECKCQKCQLISKNETFYS